MLHEKSFKINVAIQKDNCSSWFLDASASLEPGVSGRHYLSQISMKSMILNQLWSLFWWPFVQAFNTYRMAFLKIMNDRDHKISLTIWFRVIIAQSAARRAAHLRDSDIWILIIQTFGVYCQLLLKTFYWQHLIDNF